jgi:hypothetical protein
MAESAGHCAVAQVVSLTYQSGDDDPLAVSLLLNDADGKPFILTMPRLVAGNIAARVLEMVKELKKAGAPPLQVQRTPEVIQRFQASPLDDTDGVLLTIDGDRSTFFGKARTQDARSLAAVIEAAARSSGPTRTN